MEHYEADDPDFDPVAIKFHELINLGYLGQAAIHLRDNGDEMTQFTPGSDPSEIGHMELLEAIAKDGFKEYEDVVERLSKTEKLDDEKYSVVIGVDLITKFDMPADRFVNFYLRKERGHYIFLDMLKRQVGAENPGYDTIKETAEKIDLEKKLKRYLE